MRQLLKVIEIAFLLKVFNYIVSAVWQGYPALNLTFICQIFFLHSGYYWDQILF